MTTILSTGIRLGLVVLLWMPLVVTQDTIFPFGVGKALYARSLIEVITALWVVLMLLDPVYRPHRSWVILAFAVYLVVSFLSAVAGVNFIHSIWSDYQRMTGLWDLAHWFLLVLVAASVLRSPRGWRSLLNWHLGVALTFSLLSFAQAYGMPVPSYLSDRCRVDATLGNPAYLAALLIAPIIVATGFLARSFMPRDAEDESNESRRSSHTPMRLRGRRKGTQYQPVPLERRALPLWRAFWILTAAICLWILFLTGTRGALVGLVAGALAMPIIPIMLRRREVLRAIAPAAAGILLAIAALFALDYWIGLPVGEDCKAQTVSRRMTSAVTGGSTTMRVALIEVGLRAFLDRPLLGWGPDNFARAFDRHASASIYQHTPNDVDQAHNKVVEELATKGILGTLSFLALWAVLFWTIARRRRDDGEEVLAYAVFGALAGYFVQNLFLFDTPGMLLQWSLLVAWVTALERRQDPGSRAAEARPSRSRQQNRPRPSGSHDVQGLAFSWVKGVLVIGVTVALGLSLYQLNYRPYAAAQLFYQAWVESENTTDRLILARRSFEMFPDLASWPRMNLFLRLTNEWEDLSIEEHRKVLDFVILEGDQSIKADPRNAQILNSVLPIRQATFPKEDLWTLSPLVQKLEELAPERLYTYLRMASQELRLENYRETLQIIDQFEAMTPWWNKSAFQGIRQAAQAGLGKEE